MAGTKPEYYLKNRERIKERTSAYSKANPDVNRRSKRKQYYGISDEQYQDLASRANGHCELCGRKPKRLIIDHNHNTGAVRGLVCDGCNHHLRCIDDEELLAKTIAWRDNNGPVAEES